MPSNRIVVIVVASALIVCHSLTKAAAQEPATQPSTQPASTPPAASDPLREAIDAYRAANYDQAAKLAAAVSKSIKKTPGPIVDRLHLDSLHLQLIAHQRLERHPAAAEIASQLFLSTADDRAMLLNVASCDIRAQSYVIRSAKKLRDYAIAHPTDEVVINMWGAALSTMSKQAKPAEMEEQEAAYLNVDAQLEATKPGSKRWGSRWISTAEFDEIREKKQRVTRNINAQEEEVDRLEKVLNRARRRLEEARADMRQGPRDTAAARQRRVSNAETHYDQCRDEYEEGVSKLKEIRERMPRPSWVTPAGPFEPPFLQAD